MRGQKQPLVIEADFSAGILRIWSKFEILNLQLYLQNIWLYEVIRIFQNNLVTLVMFEKSSKREKSTTRKEEFYFSSGSNLIVCCFCGVLLSCILRFPLQKWSFCGQGVSNHSWLSASHFLTRPFFCLDGTEPSQPRTFSLRARPHPTLTYDGSKARSIIGTHEE